MRDINAGALISINMNDINTRMIEVLLNINSAVFFFVNDDRIFLGFGPNSGKLCNDPSSARGLNIKR